MVKKEFVTAIAEKTGFTKKDTAAFIDAFAASVTDALIKGEDIRIAGLGTYTTAIRAPRVCRNPQTGETMTVEAKRVPKFKVSKTLKDAVL